MKLRLGMLRRTPPARERQRVGLTLMCCGALVFIASCGSAPNPGAESSTETSSNQASSSGAPPSTGYQGRPITGAAEPGQAPVPTRPPAGRVVALPDGAQPWGVAVAPSVGQVYVALRKPDRLAVYDIASGAVRTVPAPGAARMIDLAGPDGPLLLPAEDRATLYALSLPSLDVIGQVDTARQPHQAVRVGDTTFVTEEFGHAVRAVRDGKKVAEFPEPVQPGGITAVGNRVAAVDVATSTLFIYDADTLKLVAALPAGAGPSHVVPIGGSRVAVCDVRGHAVITYDLAGQPRQLGKADVPGRAFWIEANPDTGTVYAALSDTNMVAKLQVAPDGTPRLLSTVPTVRQPNSMDLDRSNGTLYVAGNADSALQIVPAGAFN